MAKVFIYPATSLILSDLVARYGHTPLSSAVAIRERIQTAGLESPPLQITPEEPKKGLEVGGRRGARGRPGPDVALRPADRGVRGGDHHQRRRPRVRLHGLCPHKRAGPVPRPPARESRYSNSITRRARRRECGSSAAIKEFLTDLRRCAEMTAPVRIALLGCGPSTRASSTRSTWPPGRSGRDLLPRRDPHGYPVATSGRVRPRRPEPADLKLAIARAKALVEGRVEADAVFIATCFRCAEAAIVRNELRRYIHEALEAPGRQLLVHRADDLGDAPDPDGGAHHDRPPARPARPRAAGGAHHGPRLGLGDHEGDHHAGQQDDRDRLAPDDRGQAVGRRGDRARARGSPGSAGTEIAGGRGDRVRPVPARERRSART